MGIALLATAASLYMQGLIAAPRPAADPATDRYRQIVLTIGCDVALGLLVTISSVGAGSMGIVALHFPLSDPADANAGGRRRFARRAARACFAVTASGLPLGRATPVARLLMLFRTCAEVAPREARSYVHVNALYHERKGYERFGRHDAPLEWRAPSGRGELI
jgi:hypothetical protein